MPTLTIANTFVDAATASAAEVMENIYNPQETTPDSLDVINGLLDDANKDTADNIGRHKAQPFTFASPRMAGATANLDFIEDRWWQGIDISTGDDDQEFLPIPGASINYYQPYDCTIVLICWQISWGTDADASTEVSPIKLFTSTNGAQDGTRRQTSTTIDTSVRYGKNADQWYTGHFALTGETAGWKHASLRICSDAEQTRVRVRNMIVIPFR